LSNPKTLILGIGNNLLSDEGVGIHAVAMLERVHGTRADVTCLDGGTLSFTLAGVIAEHANLIVIDAARFGGPPGGIRCFEGEAMDAYLRGVRKSAHEVGLNDLLDIARLSETLPRRRALVGVEPQDLDWGEAPSPAVSRALPQVLAEVQALLERWQMPDDGGNRRTG
jgi:hydrogenase maturation protease